MSENINFVTGKLSVSEETVDFTSINPNIADFQSLNLEQVGRVNYSEFVYLKRLPMQFGFRYGALGLLIYIAAVIIAYTLDSQTLMTLFSLLFLVTLLISVFLVFGEMFLDGLLGMNVVYPLCQKLFGEQGFEVIIQDRTGSSNIHFFVGLGEEQKIKNINTLLDKHKINLPKNSTAGGKSSDLEDLAKLAELKEKGIISEEEFQAKKSQILDL
jgi:hypothetical protein